MKASLPHVPSGDCGGLVTPRVLKVQSCLKPLHFVLILCLISEWFKKLLQFLFYPMLTSTALCMQTFFSGISELIAPNKTFS